MDKLNDIRTEIDKIDDQILALLNERLGYSLAVKKTKQGSSAIRPEREQQIVKRLVTKNTGPLTEEAIGSIFASVINQFRNIQLAGKLKVGYLGPKGTYSQEAVERLFGEDISLESEQTLPAVFRSVEAGTIQIAVIPIENSSEGAVREAHKLLLDTNAKIVSEITLPVVHCLLSKQSELAEIQTIYAHPQSFGQCRAWLATHLPKAKQISVDSNAAAAEMASKEPSTSAIASNKTAEIYDINIVEKGINDQPDNQTRFIAIGKFETQPTGDDKTSLVCVIKDKPGALHELLGVLAGNDISMTRLESQPYKAGQYAFYIDFIGHTKDAKVARAVDDMSRHTQICKVLGSYPVGVKTK